MGRCHTHGHTPNQAQQKFGCGEQKFPTGCKYALMPAVFVWLPFPFQKRKFAYVPAAGQKGYVMVIYSFTHSACGKRYVKKYDKTPDRFLILVWKI